MKTIPLGKGTAAVLAASFAGLLHLACGSPGKVGDNGNSGSGGGGTAGVSIDPTITLGGASGTVGAGGTSGASGSTGSVEGVCGDTTITANKAPVDVLLVLDRSDSLGWSMSNDCYCTSWPASERQGSLCDPQPANCVDRRSVVMPAVSQTVAANPGLNWGLELFSAPNSPPCSVSSVPQVLIGPDTGSQIQSLLSDVSLQLWTPTTTAVIMATNYLANLNDGNSKVILLATDGEPNCKDGQQRSDDDIDNTTKAVYAASLAGIPTYVIGIGPAQALTNLDRLAQAGGTGSFYRADSPQALSDSLAAIAQIIVATCEFRTPMSPPDTAKVYVYVDKSFVGQSAENGWTFGATSSDIVLTGTYCADMKAGVTSTVQIIFGCEDYIPPLNIP
jgi:hypothetical protein